MNISFFDFDGTITTRDSLADFTRYSVGSAAYYAGLIILSPMLASYVFKLTPNYRAKELFISYFFKNWDEEKFRKLADRYALEEIDKITRPEAMEQIRWHKQQGDKIVIVSASIECWLKKWCDKNGIELISTRLEIKNGKLTGKFATKNCHGPEKVSRIKARYNLDEFDHVYAYGDSHGDKELLELANTAAYKPFR